MLFETIYSVFFLNTLSPYFLWLNLFQKPVMLSKDWQKMCSLGLEQETTLGKINFVNGSDVLKGT